MLINKTNITLCEGDFVALFLETSSHRYWPSGRSLHKCTEAFPRPHSVIISSTAPSPILHSPFSYPPQPLPPILHSPSPYPPQPLPPFLDIFFSYVLYLLSTAFALRYTAERSPKEGEAHLSASLLCLKIALPYSKPSINICWMGVRTTHCLVSAQGLVCSRSIGDISFIIVIYFKSVT